MLPPATHSLLQPSNLPPGAMDSYYQQVLQSGIAGPYGSMFPHRPLPMMHSNGFIPTLNQQNGFYPPASLPSATSPQQRSSPEHIRSNSISPSSLSSHSPNRLTASQSPPAQTKQIPHATASDDESDIEVWISP